MIKNKIISYDIENRNNNTDLTPHSAYKNHKKEI